MAATTHATDREDQSCTELHNGPGGRGAVGRFPGRLLGCRPGSGGWRQVQVSLRGGLEQSSASWLPTTSVRLPTLGCGDQMVPDVDQKRGKDQPTNILVHQVRHVSHVGSGVGPRRTGPEIRHRGTAASHRVGLRSASRWSPQRGRRRMLRRGRSTSRSSSTLWTWPSSSATCWRIPWLSRRS